MNLMILAGIAAGLAATPPTDLVHHVDLDHGARTVRVSYHGDVTVRQKQVGMSLPGRQGTARCVWQAEMQVERRIAGAPAGGVRPVNGGPAASGSRHGDCTAMRKAIAKEVAAATPDMHQALAEAARRDRPQLLADLDGAGHI
ncbi:MAG: hypothetical protein ABW173_10540, partial [Sphingomonas sp.]